MIKIKYEQLLSKGFQLTMGRIMGTPLPMKAAYQLKKMMDAIIHQHEAAFAIFRKEIVEPFGIRDNAGKPVIPFVCDPVNEAAYNALWEEFKNREVTIDRCKLPIEWLDGLRLSANDMATIEVIFQETPPVADTANVVPLKDGA